jgi:intracellular septation protein A
MKASVISYRAAVILALVGVMIGIVMAVTHDHAVMPAHAHLNLLGWASLFLFGVFYQLHPVANHSVLGRIQVLTWITGTVMSVVGIALIYTGHLQGEPLAGVGSMIVFAGLIMFIYVVFIETSAKNLQQHTETALPIS